MFILVELLNSLQFNKVELKSRERSGRREKIHPVRIPQLI